MANLLYRDGDSFIDFDFGIDPIDCYPVGSIYISANSTSPATLFGGTWTPITDGRFLRPSGSWNQTGGTDTHTHWTNIGKAAGETSIYVADDTSWAGSSSQVSTTFGGAQLTNFTPLYAQNRPLMRQGSTAPTSTLPSYRTAYFWRRTA